jgi:single-strand selective monofunctional uracil DNA glycosylase
VPFFGLAVDTQAPKSEKQEPMTIVDAVTTAAANLRDSVDRLDFSDHVPWVYNPLQYAWQAHEQYLTRFAKSSCRVLFLGMNPGPWGMAQCGIPFGEIEIAVRWLGIDAVIEKPVKEHPKRPIEGLRCARSEVSGRRLWGLFRDRFKTPSAFFKHHFVTNYCPLVFMEESARNITPDKLPADAAAPLEQLCDQHLRELIDAMKPEWVIGVGAYAEQCARRVVENGSSGKARQCGRILHPSPASPAANRDWSGTATKQLVELGIWE